MKSGIISMGVTKYIIDPNMPDIEHIPNLTKIKTVATEGMEKVFSELMS